MFFYALIDVKSVSKAHLKRHYLNLTYSRNKMKPLKIFAIFVYMLLAVAARAQDNLPPVEIKCDKLFEQVQAKNLHFGVSTNRDIMNFFGSDCTSGCNFDERWKIKFEYFGVVSMSKKVGDMWNTYLPNRDFRGRLYSIQLVARERVAFGRYKFSNCPDRDKAKNDGLVLPYQVGFSLGSDCSPRVLADFDKCNLESINYGVSEELENKMLILQSSRPYSGLGNQEQ